MSEIFKVFGVEWKMLLVNIFNFTVLVIALTYLLYKPVIKLIDERRRKIEKGLHDAEKAKEKLESIKSEEKEILSKAQAKAQENLANAEELAKKEREKILQEAQSKALTTVASAKRQAEEEKKAIMQEAKDEIAKEAVLAAKKILAAN